MPANCQVSKGMSISISIMEVSMTFANCVSAPKGNLSLTLRMRIVKNNVGFDTKKASLIGLAFFVFL